MTRSAFSRSTFQPRAALIRPPTSRSTSGDVIGKRLSARRTDTRKLSARSVLKIAKNTVRVSSVEIQLGPRRVREIGDTERPPDAFAHVFARRIGTKHHLDATHQRPHGLDVQIGNGAAKIADEPRQEPRTVLSFERDLLIVDDDRVHGDSITTRLPACPHGG